MNILHHKSWHVRTKENIARVRRDEAKAAADETEKQRRADEAESEARIDFLRKRTNVTSTITSEDASNTDGPVPSGGEDGKHVDLFADYQDKQKKIKPMDEEKRLEQEKYEKQIGYLTYLGQDTNEALGTRNWYDVAPKRQDEFDEQKKRIEVGLKTKHLHDPMLRFLKQPLFESKASEVKPKDIEEKKSADSFSDITAKDDDEEAKHSKKLKKEKKKHKHKHKHKKRKHKSKRSSDSSECDEDELKKIKMEKLRILREQRLQREMAEKSRTQEFLIQKFPELAPPPPPPDKKREDKERAVPFVKQKYNSQFNPFLAKQNYS